MSNAFDDCYTITDSGCWEWRRLRNQAGYGIFRHNGRQVLAHRFSLERKTGSELGKLCALHKCDNPPCVNPDHLFVGTRLDNRLDAMAKGRPLPAPRGERCVHSRLTANDIPMIRELRLSGLTYRAIASRFGVYHSCIIKICKNQSWKHLPV